LTDAGVFFCPVMVFSDDFSAHFCISEHEFWTDVGIFSVIQPKSLFLTGVCFVFVLGFLVLMGWSLALKDPRRERL
jgi:hypothetical protein